YNIYVCDVNMLLINEQYNSDTYHLSLHDALPIFLCRLADIAMEIFAVESALLRAKKILALKGEEEAKYPIMITQCLVNDNGILGDRKSTRLNSSHVKISYDVFFL